MLRAAPTLRQVERRWRGATFGEDAFLTPPDITALRCHFSFSVHLVNISFTTRTNVSHFLYIERLLYYESLLTMETNVVEVRGYVAGMIYKWHIWLNQLVATRRGYNRLRRDFKGPSDEACNVVPAVSVFKRNLECVPTLGWRRRPSRGTENSPTRAKVSLPIRALTSTD